MTHPHRYFAGLLVLLLLLALYWLWPAPRPATLPPPKLAVAFVSITNNSVLALPGIGVGRGASGLCAIFSVTNIAGTNIAKDPWVWFDTPSVERKTDAGWERIVPDSNVWSGVEGRLWVPGYGGLYAVGWPPGIPTNVIWRLRVRYGREPFVMGVVANQRLGWKLFPSGKEEQTISSSEAKQ